MDIAIICTLTSCIIMLYHLFYQLSMLIFIYNICMYVLYIPMKKRLLRRNNGRRLIFLSPAKVLH